MYSPISRYASQVLAILLLLLAGAMLRQPRSWTSFGLLGGVGVLFLLCYGYESFRKGTRPLRKLRPGEYVVDAVVYGDRLGVILAISWHVDYGHCEYRLAQLARSAFSPRMPEVDDKIRVSRQFPSTYFVHPAVHRGISD